jgi:hypothetical protein
MAGWVLILLLFLLLSLDRSRFRAQPHTLGSLSQTRSVRRYFIFIYLFEEVVVVVVEAKEEEDGDDEMPQHISFFC